MNADDTAIMVDNIADMQSMTNNIVLYDFCLRTDPDKSKVFGLVIKGNIIQLTSYKHLGTLINSQIDQKVEISSRKEQARNVFIQILLTLVQKIST